MSDMFNHELDAWESYDQEQEYGPDWWRDDFRKNSLHYHRQYTFRSVVAETEKAILLELTCTEYDDPAWVPKSLCRCLDRKAKTVYIWKGFDIPEIKGEDFE